MARKQTPALLSPPPDPIRARVTDAIACMEQYEETRDFEYLATAQGLLNEVTHMHIEEGQCREGQC